MCFFTLFRYWVRFGGGGIGCALLGVDSLRGGLAEGNKIFKVRFFSETLLSPLGWVWVIIW